MLFRATILFFLFVSATYSIRCFNCSYSINPTIGNPICLEPEQMKQNESFMTECQYGCVKVHVDITGPKGETAYALLRKCSTETDEVGCESRTEVKNNVTFDIYTCVSKDELSNSTATWSLSCLLFFILYIGYYW
ncbi:unnamed protein product [Bursaphelenchus okinawaensis]|uniref:Protein sleepless n=1 Tax=Bursaphelenchus okinawaensis TaxID=465554 RepID=A0A811KC75_9BILA|nr:unnamed protein product [Bursaphelenchus okinawaensis]CAG9098247.1 unnamed protein product [Bursaphelenchus okinawaensis]